MSPVTHFLTGWVVANTASLSRRERALITLAALAPDVDGLGVIPELLTRHSAHPLLWFSQYHHALHNLVFAVVVAGAVFALATRGWPTALLALLAFHLHLLEDLVGSRGPDGFDWPIPYLAPFAHRYSWTWDGQWALNAWPNLGLTLLLLAITIWLARTRGISPVNLFSTKSDRAVVAALWRH